ncbi:MAG: glycosyltransferase family 4 protein [Planctomycetota bacterium]
MTQPTKPIRVAIQQPVLPAYRVPVFRELANRAGIDLKLYYGDRTNGPSSVEPEGFDAEMVHLNEGRIGRHPVVWHSPQWKCASRKVSDVLVLTWDLHYASLVPGLLRAKANGVRTVLWGHGYSKQEAAWRGWPRKRLAALADALLFYNEPTAQRFIESGWNPERIYVARNTIEQSPIQAARQHWLDRPNELADFQKQQQVDTCPVILFVSRMDPYNRLDLLVEAIPKLNARFPGVQAIIIGKGDEEQKRLEALSKQLQVAEQVRFLGPIYDEEQLAAWMLSADLFCYPANIGLSILHAFGYGLPVVTSDRTESQNPEIVCLRHEENGLLYDNGDAEALAQAISRILGDDTFRTRLSGVAHQTATEAFSLINMVDGMEAAIRGPEWAVHQPSSG